MEKTDCYLYKQGKMLEITVLDRIKKKNPGRFRYHRTGYCRDWFWQLCFCYCLLFYSVLEVRYQLHCCYSINYISVKMFMLF